jgi:glycosyltransferase involved in cell wall biosynthesis
MAKVSIIVTAYNIEPYIDQCLRSVAEQTLPDLEVIVVDDGSTDGTARRIRDFAATDPRFVPVLLPTNSPGGVATAANAGLDRATAPWVGFVDGDDYVEPTMVASLLAAAEGHDTDLAMCQYREVTDEGESRPPADASRWVGLPGGPHLLDAAETRRFLRFIAVPWRKLYRRSMVEAGGIRFPVGDFFFEDNPFHWFAVVSARSIAVVPEVLCYHRVSRSGQTMATADARLLKIFGHHATIRAWLVEQDRLAELGVTLLEWVISQAEWISARTPKALRRELFDTLRPIFAQYDPAMLDAALQDGRKGTYARQLCAALMSSNYTRFAMVLAGRPDTNSYLRAGLYHLRYSGVRHTLTLAQRVVRSRAQSLPVLRLLRPRAVAGVQAHSHTDLMFALTVLQHQVEQVERRLDEITARLDRPDGGSVDVAALHRQRSPGRRPIEPVPTVTASA